MKFRPGPMHSCWCEQLATRWLQLVAMREPGRPARAFGWVPVCDAHARFAAWEEPFQRAVLEAIGVAPGEGWWVGLAGHGTGVEAI